MFTGEITASQSYETLEKEKDKARQADGRHGRSGALRVLVVDDDFAAKVLVTAMLEVHNCRVDRAEDGAKALDCMASKDYDLVLTDLNMPVMDGHTLACAVRSQRPETKIVIMTDSSRMDVETMMTGCQVDDWLFKPFGLGEIRRILDRFDWL